MVADPLLTICTLIPTEVKASLLPPQHSTQTFSVFGGVKRSISWRHCKTATRGHTTNVARQKPPLEQPASSDTTTGGAPANHAHTHR